MNILAMFTAISISQGLPPKLLESVCWVESKHNIHAIHHDDGSYDSLGICQIQLPTAKQLGFEGPAAQLMIPKYNIYYASLYLRHQIIRYNNNIEKALVAYNQGSAGFLSNSRYSDMVMEEYKRRLNANFNMCPLEHVPNKHDNKCTGSKRN
jgi:soluble lytic murein transglycosylase-like protein